MEDNKFSKRIYYVLLFLSIIVTSLLSKELSSIILPVLFAILLAFIFLPLLNFIHKKFKLPWTLCCIFIILILIVIIIVISSLLVTSLTAITNEYPKYEERFTSIYKILAEKFKFEFDAGKSFIENMWSHLNIRDFIKKSALLFSGELVSAGKSIFITLLLFSFLIIELESFEEKFIILSERNNKIQLTSIFNSIITEVSSYLSIKFYISLATGLIVFLGTSLIGLSFPIVWGFFAFVMNFIPTFGSIISSLITTVFALVQFYPCFQETVFTFILMLSVNMILGNILEPRIEGDQLGISPFSILISLSFFGWMWGFIGLILALPMTVIIKIVCENISFLNFVPVIIGNKKKVIKKFKLLKKSRNKKNENTNDIDNKEN